MSMRNLFCLAVLSAALASGAEDYEDYAYPKSPERIGTETDAEKEARIAWWRNDRFGMFIHFGLYAMPARHEWVRSKERIDDAAYEKYFRKFNPDLFDAREWARAAKAAGMKYMVLTTKHHEGFCLWDTKTTDYKITRTPFGRDLVREYVDACRAEGLKVGFYYSVIDWHHPDYTIDHGHPLRPAERFTDASYAAVNRGRDMARYRKYMFAQVEELLTQYGKIDIVWFDYTSKGRYGKTWKDWDAPELLRMTRRLQPLILIDNRLGLDDTVDGGDFVTPEQFKVPCWPKRFGKEFPWETCQTFSGSWGYFRDETTWKSAPQLIELLVHAVSFGGNLIMNVGPTARGVFDPRATDRLEAFGRWMRLNARAVYGCTRAPSDFVAPAGTLLTYNPSARRLYIHLINYPAGALAVDFLDRIDYVQFLHDGSELMTRSARDSDIQSGEMRMPGQILLPVLKPDVSIPVIEVFLK